MKYPKLVIIKDKKVTEILKNLFWEYKFYHCNILPTFYLNYSFYGLSEEVLKSKHGFCLIFKHLSKYILKKCKENQAFA